MRPHTNPRAESSLWIQVGSWVREGLPHSIAGRWTGTLFNSASVPEDPPFDPGVYPRQISNDEGFRCGVGPLGTPRGTKSKRDTTDTQSNVATKQRGDCAAHAGDVAGARGRMSTTLPNVDFEADSICGDAPPFPKLSAIGTEMRRDVLDGFKAYNGTLKLDDTAYWGSLAWVTLPMFIALVLFAATVAGVLPFLFCRRKREIERQENRVGWILLLVIGVLTAGVCAGCILSWYGFGKTSQVIDGGFNLAKRNADEVYRRAHKVDQDTSIMVDKYLSTFPSNWHGDINESDRAFRRARVSQTVKDTKDDLRTIEKEYNKYFLAVAIVITVVATASIAVGAVSLYALIKIKRRVFRWSLGLTVPVVLIGWIIATGFLMAAYFEDDTCNAMDYYVDFPDDAVFGGKTVCPRSKIKDAQQRFLHITQASVHLLNGYLQMYTEEFLPHSDAKLYCHPYKSVEIQNCNFVSEHLVSTVPADCPYPGANNTFSIYDRKTRLEPVLQFVCSENNETSCQEQGRPILQKDFHRFTGFFEAVDISVSLKGLLSSFDNCDFQVMTFRELVGSTCSDFNHYVNFIIGGYILTSSCLFILLWAWLYTYTRLPNDDIIMELERIRTGLPKFSK